MNKKAIGTWVGILAGFFALAAGSAKMVIRVSDIEQKANRIDEMEHQIRVINITLKLISPEKHKQAEDLAQ